MVVSTSRARVAPEGGRAPRDHARKARHLKFRLQLARPRQPPSKLVPSSATNSARLPPLAHRSQLIFEWPWLCWQNGDQPLSLRCARRWKEVRMSEVGMWHREKRAHAERNFFEIPLRRKCPYETGSLFRYRSLFGFKPLSAASVPRLRAGPPAPTGGYAPGYSVAGKGKAPPFWNRPFRRP